MISWDPSRPPFTVFVLVVIRTAGGFSLEVRRTF